MKIENCKIAIVGLGYVGLPLAVEFSKKFPTIGYDINKNRIIELQNNLDKTLEVDTNKLLTAFNKNNLKVTYESDDIANVNFFIVTVPTPIDKNNKPDLTPLINASVMIANLLKKGDVVVYESTVYPGCTEEVCVPILEKNSNLKFNVDFFCGYSPERINPGDKVNILTNIIKITSGSTKESALFINSIYKSIIIAGTHMTSTIKIAEAAKVIENSQRDINIAFVNELSKIFNKLDIDTSEVLEAAGTKWNFLNFKPGLVGGHCIGVDPYYLAQKAQEVGYHPEIILAGRRLNDNMGTYVATEVIRLMINKGIKIKNSNILVLGITFKENCPDIRNTKVVDIIYEFKRYSINVCIYDPNAIEVDVEKEYKLKLIPNLDGSETYDAIVIAVAHNEFLNLNLEKIKKSTSVIFDVKSIFNLDKIDKRL